MLTKYALPADGSGLGSLSCDEDGGFSSTFAAGWPGASMAGSGCFSCKYPVLYVLFICFISSFEKKRVRWQVGGGGSTYKTMGSSGQALYRVSVSQTLACTTEGPVQHLYHLDNAWPPLYRQLFCQTEKATTFAGRTRTHTHTQVIVCAGLALADASALCKPCTVSAPPCKTALSWQACTSSPWGEKESNPDPEGECLARPGPRTRTPRKKLGSLGGA